MAGQGDSQYRQAIDWLYATQKTGIKLGLENTRRLLDCLGNPERELRFFHVAGTNGKGSVCAMLDAGLRACGFRTGLFTSPHLVRFGERMRVNGEAISDERLADLIDGLRKSATPDLAPTFFEITTALGLLYFREMRVEVVILETGMGGRLDSTNVVTPLVSVVTAIDLDHTQWLGNTLAEIAGEKAGIIKPGVPVISTLQMPEAELVLRERAMQAGSAIEFVGPMEIDLHMKGSHQKINAAAALRALELSGLAYDRHQAEQGVGKAEWAGRFDEIAPGWILDGAHNPAAVRRLILTWREVFGDCKPVVIFGALRDKDALGMLQALAQIASRFVLCPVRSERAITLEELAGFASQLSVSTKIAKDVEEALTEVSGEPNVLIAGSLFLAGEVLALRESGQMEASSQ